MNFDDLRTDPLASDRARPVAWFSWHDEAPRSGDGVDSGGGDRDGAPAPHGAGGNGGAPSLSPERLSALRQWIAEGGHNSPLVAEQVARRILDRGDL